MKNRKSKIIISIVLALVLIVICVTFIVYFGKSVSIKKFMAKELPVYGISGYGKITKSDVFDEALLIDTLGSDYYEWITDNSYFDPVEDNIMISINKESDLSNGDEVTVNIRVNYDRINSYDFKKKLRGKKNIEKTYTVSGLTEPKTVDVFEAMNQIDYISGNLYLEFDKSYYKEDDGFAVMFENKMIVLRDPRGNYIAELSLRASDIEPNDNDEVTVKIVTENSSYYGEKYTEISDRYKYEKYGFILSETSKSFKVTKWKTINDVSEINGKSFDEMKEHAVYEADEATSSSWKNISLENLFYYKDSENPCMVAIFEFTKVHYDETSEASFFVAYLYGISTYEDRIEYGNLEYGNEFDDYSEYLKNIRSDSDYVEIKFK